MRPGRVVDLSHAIVPGDEEYTCELRTWFTDELFPQYSRKPDEWYIISEVTMNVHCGTHVEAPLHHVRDGDDIAEVELDKLVGEAIVLDFTRFGENEEITLDDLLALKERIRPGDIVFCRCWGDERYGTERQHDRPYFATDAIEWLVKEARIRCLGTDTSGIEVRDAEGKSTGSQPNHKMLLESGVPLVEYLANLDQLRSERFTALIMPIKIAGAEAFPARVLAIEDWEVER